MFKTNYPKSLFLAITIFGVAAIAYSQGQRPAGPPQETRFGQAGQPGGPRPNLMRELGLSPEQIRSIRLLNQERKPAERIARKRFQDANRALNQAIYADSVDDVEYRARLVEFQTAQAELARIKFSNELAVRKLLTPDQLLKFRELRRRFAEDREDKPETDGPQGPTRPALERLRRNQPRVN